MGKNQRAEIFDNAIANRQKLPEAMAEGIIADYPFFTPAIVAALQENGNINEDGREKLIKLAAANMADRIALCDIAGPEAGKFRNFYPDESVKKVKSTMDTIEHFLDTFGNDDEAEIKALEQKIFNPVPDYAQLLEKEERDSLPSENELDEQTMSANDLLINKFITMSKKKEAHFPSQEETVPPEVAEAPSPKSVDDQTDNSMLSESLAKIYIRQHRYEKALEIILSLSLNFPEKSIYFADQIRFLRKLIVNEKYKQKNNN